MTETTTETVAEKPVRRGVGTVIKEAILAGKTNEEALSAAKAEFPESATTAATVSWYRNQLRKDGHTVPTARELKKAAAAAAAVPATTEGEAPATTETDPLA